MSCLKLTRYPTLRRFSSSAVASSLHGHSATLHSEGPFTCDDYNHSYVLCPLSFVLSTPVPASIIFPSSMTCGGSGWSLGWLQTTSHGLGTDGIPAAIAHVPN